MQYDCNKFPRIANFDLFQNTHGPHVKFCATVNKMPAKLPNQIFIDAENVG